MSALTRLGPGGYPVAASGVTITATGEADGQASASGAASSTAATAGTANGQASGSGASSSTAATAGTANGQASASGAASSTASTTGAANGQASVSGAGRSIYAAGGEADGQANASGAARSAYTTTGTANGQASASGAASSTITAAGAANGQASASGSVPIGLTGSSLVALIGRWASMLLSGQVHQLKLASHAAVMLLSGQVSQLKLASRAAQLELDRMSTRQDGKFHLGETWIITGLARDQNGATLDLTGATVALRIGNENPNSLILDLATPTNGSINTPATAGRYTFLITPTQQASMTLTSYEYEVRVTLSNGNVTVQNRGVIEVEPSLFVNFP